MSLSFRLETERLLLERLTLDDAELMLAVWNDPAFHRYVGDRGIRTVDEARQALTGGALKLYADYGHGPYRLTLKSAGVAIGVCGLFRRDGLDDTDIGFSILPRYCGQGLAYEAARAVIDHARDDIKLARLTALVSAENSASIGLIEKLGFDFEAISRIPGEDEDVRLYALRLNDQGMNN